MIYFTALKFLKNQLIKIYHLQLSGNIEFNEYANKVHISNKQNHEEPEDFIVTGWGTLSVSTKF